MGWWRIAGWSERTVLLIAGVVLVALCAYELVVAWGLRIDYYDSYVNLLNARRLIDWSTPNYDEHRSQLLPLLLAPVTALGRGSPLLTLRLVHLEMVGCYAGMAGCGYLLFRQGLGRRGAAVATVLLASNSLILNFAPVAKETVPEVVLLCAGFLSLLRLHRSPRMRWAVLAGTLLGAAATNRYQLAPVAPVAVIAHWALLNRAPLARRAWATLTPSPYLVAGCIRAFAVVFVAIPCLAFSVEHTTTIWRSPLHLARLLLEQLVYAQRVAVHESALTPLGWLPDSVPLPILALAGAGAVIGLRRMDTVATLMVTWFVGYFVFMAVASHKEAHYFTATLPPLYYLALRGGIDGTRLLLNVSSISSMRRLVPAAVVLVVAASLAEQAGLGFRELARLHDPVYTSDFEAVSSEYAAGLAPPRGRVLWFGQLVPLVPSDHVFDQSDLLTYVYHDSAWTLAFWSDRDVVERVGAVRVTPANGATTLLSLPLGSRVRDGDVVAISDAPDVRNFFGTSVATELPGRPVTVTVERIQIVEWAAPVAMNPAPLYEATGGERLTVVIGENATVFSGQGIPAEWGELYSGSPGQADARLLQMVTIGEGRFATTVPVTNAPTRYFLLLVRDGRRFVAPQA